MRRKNGEENRREGRGAKESKGRGELRIVRGTENIREGKERRTEQRRTEEGGKERRTVEREKREEQIRG